MTVRPSVLLPINGNRRAATVRATRTLEHVQAILVVCDYRAFNALRQVKARLISRVFPGHRVP